MKDKIILVTGASSGIGQSCAVQFAKHGAKLILLARREDKLKDLQQCLMNDYQTETLILTVDMSVPEAIVAAMQSLPQAWQAIDVLINNAGLAAGLDKAQSAHLNDWISMLDTNVRGLMTITHTLLPGMIARQQGYIVNMGSMAGVQNYAGASAYCATKAAVHAFNECLKMDLTGTPIRVTEILPGMVETSFSQVRFKGDTTRADAVYQGLQPLTPDDIADLVYFCVSRPAHVNILNMLVMPTAQSSPTLVHRE